MDNLYRIEACAKLIQNAKHLAVITGAGISTPSGIPDFRSPEKGLWKQYDPMKVASLTSFRSSPEIFYNWLRPLAQKIRVAAPNPAHDAIAKLEHLGLAKSVITQNIDFLHQRAGSKNVIEVHGSLNSFSCPKCSSLFPWDEVQDEFVFNDQLPRCRKCNSILKPDIVLFEEQLPQAAWIKATIEMEKADVVLIAGTSLEVTPANELPLYALQLFAHLIIVNLSPTYLDTQADFVFHEDAALILPKLVLSIETRMINHVR
ncbi:MAG: NAD-dependent deacylase [Anaerolineaceae bacterium]